MALIIITKHDSSNFPLLPSHCDQSSHDNGLNKFHSHNTFSTLDSGSDHLAQPHCRSYAHAAASDPAARQATRHNIHLVNRHCQNFSSSDNAAMSTPSPNNQQKITSHKGPWPSQHREELYPNGRSDYHHIGETSSNSHEHTYAKNNTSEPGFKDFGSAHYLSLWPKFFHLSWKAITLGFSTRFVLLPYNSPRLITTPVTTIKTIVRHLLETSLTLNITQQTHTPHSIINSSLPTHYLLYHTLTLIIWELQWLVGTVAAWKTKLLLAQWTLDPSMFFASRRLSSRTIPTSYAKAS